MIFNQLLLATIFSSYILLLKAEYILNITLHSYAGNGRCAGCLLGGIYGCCDRFDTLHCGIAGVNPLRCDAYFIYCLLPLNANTAIAGAYARSPVPCTARERSDHAINDAPIDFSQNTVLGLSNPLLFNGISSTWEGVLLQIVAYDYDSGQDDLIDVFRLAINMREGSSVLLGTYGFAQLGFSYQVLCTNGFYGDRCQYFNDCPSPDVCGSHGVCIDRDDDYYCQCDPNYTGATCSETMIDHCTGIDCSGNGQCMDEGNSYICVCDTGFTGENCSINIDDCAGVTCTGHGQCKDGVNLYTCVCDAGFTGNDCSIDIDNCVAVDCSGHGQCVDEVNSYVCVCDNGFTDFECSVNIDDCIGVNCPGESICVDGINSYTCANCNPGFTGATCSVNIDDCIGVNCSGNGQCVDGVNSYICECNVGVSGMDCEININIDDCIGVNCSGNGQCVDGVNTYTCECDSGFIGDHCRVNIDDCTGVNCNENGQCLDGVNSYTCECDAGFTGRNCDTNIDDCLELGVSCGENGQCVDGVHSYTCECDVGFTGAVCEININSEDVHANHDHFTLPFITGGSLSAVILFLILVVLILTMILFYYQTRRRKHRQVTRTADVIESDHQANRISNIELTYNVGYGVCDEWDPEEIPDRLGAWRNELDEEDSRKEECYI